MRTATPAILLSSLVLSASFAAHAAQATPATATTAQDQTGATDAMVVGIDPKTGKLRQPTAAEIQALSQKAAKMTPRASTQAHRVPVSPRTAADARRTMRSVNGGRGIAMRVPESAMSSMTVTQDANGQLHFSENGVPQPAPATQEVSR